MLKLVAKYYYKLFNGFNGLVLPLLNKKIEI